MEELSSRHIFNRDATKNERCTRFAQHASRFSFLDEPTLGLDPQSSVEIRDFVKKLNQEQGTTVIITTHMMVDADLLCDRIAIVDHGKIIALDTSTNLKKIISGGDTMIIKLEVANLTPDIVAAIKALNCADAVTQENSTTTSSIVHGEEAFDNIIDAVRNKNGKISLHGKSAAFA